MRLGLILAVVLAWSGLGQAQDRPQVVVSGTGEIAVTPDLAILSLGASHEALDAESAMTEVSARISDVIGTLQREGVEARDIQTSRISIQPVYRNNNRTRPWFRASNQLTIRLRDMDKLGRLLGLTLADGINELGGWSSGLRFGLSDPAPYQAEARRAAVEDATARASGLAEAAGVRLGPVREIREMGGGQVVAMERASLAQARDVPIAQGELTVRVDVQIIYDLEP